MVVSGAGVVTSGQGAQVEPSIVDVTSLPVAAAVDVIVVAEAATAVVVVDAAFVVISGQPTLCITDPSLTILPMVVLHTFSDVSAQQIMAHGTVTTWG